MKISQKGWRVSGNTPADGNCFFWVMSHQLDKLNVSSVTHTQMRSNAVEYLNDTSEEKKAEITHFITTHSDLNTYQSYMARNGTYADHIIINAVTEQMSCVIHIVQADTPDTLIGTTGPTLVLGYLPNSKHYVSLEQKSYTPDDFEAVYIYSTRGRKKHFYVAKVLEVDDTEVRLRFMKKRGENIYVWPNIEDISWQTKADIGIILSTPQLTDGRGIQLQFKANELEQCR